ncbi:MAG: hypothetical protein DI604_34710 [Delftia acidovorans]|nr:MAG: hypothetical protein DI604_34710 [Delftia acidovorans]
MIQISSNALVNFVERTGLGSFDALRSDLAESLERARLSAAAIGSANFVIVADGLRYVVKNDVLVSVVESDRAPGKRRRRG